MELIGYFTHLKLEEIATIVGMVSFAVGVIFEKCQQTLRNADPVHSCSLYKEKGCSHVDGFLCDFSSCSMRIEHEFDKALEAKNNIGTLKCKSN